MIRPDFIAAIEQVIAREVPPVQQLDFEQRLGWLRRIINNNEDLKMQQETLLALDAFMKTDSLEEMRSLTIKFPFMTDFHDFVAGLEEGVEPQLQPDHRPHFKQRLGWLRQIAQEQNQ